MKYQLLTTHKKTSESWLSQAYDGREFLDQWVARHVDGAVLSYEVIEAMV